MSPLWSLPKISQDRWDKKWPFCHRGWQMGRQKHDGTDKHSYSKTLKADTNLYLDPNRPMRLGNIGKLALTRTPDTIRPTRWTITTINQHTTAQQLWRQSRHTTAPRRCPPLHVFYGLWGVGGTAAVIQWRNKHEMVLSMRCYRWINCSGHGLSGAMMGCLGTLHV